MRAIFQFVLILLLFIYVSSSHAAKTFVYCSEASPRAFNTQITTDGTSGNAAGKTIYDTLVKFVYGKTTLRPGLAKSWKISKNGQKYTFKLRKGVKFHKTKYFTPTRDFNADDVLFSFNRQRDKKHPYHMVNGGNYDYWNAMQMSKVIKDIKKKGDHIIEITLNRPESPFLANLAMAFAVILSKEYADQLQKNNNKDDIDHLPIGTGPFVFKSYKKDSTIRYIANKDYFFGAPKIDKLVFSITPEPSVRYQKLKAGECHFSAEPAPQDILAMGKEGKLKLLKGAGLNVGYLAMNVEKKPLDNVWVRKAINHALNRKAYIDAIYLGNAIQAKNPIPPTMWSYSEKTLDYKYSVKKAKDFLKKAGYPNGIKEELTLWTLPVSRPYNPNGKKMGEMMQADLAKIGIKVKLVTYEWGTYLDKSKKGEHHMIQLGWTGDNGDPDNFLSVLLSCSAVDAGSNTARWCNKKFDKILSRARTLSDVKKRSNLYLKAQEIFNNQAPWATIAHSIVYRAMAKNVIGYKLDPLGSDDFYTVDLK